MNTTTQQKENLSNDLRYSVSKTIGRKNITVNIRLNDECKNGHQDFSITAMIYEAGKPKIDKYFISGGCCHDEILKAFPQFKIFVGLHLCDYKGIPMHAVENGFYHLRQGFNIVKQDQAEFKAEFCDYYRVTFEQFDALNKSQNKLQYALNLQNLGILEQWENEANKAIELLENMTGKTFLVDSKKTQFNAPTPDQIQEEKDKINAGYYTIEQQEQREKQKAETELQKLNEAEEKEIADIKTEYAVKKQVLAIGGKTALDNCIYYTHTKTIAFNWRGYDKISDSLVQKLQDEMTLPEGVKFKI